ncbi:MAG: flagellar biosynthesis protein FlhB [Marinicaulis sp.]|nr:flagellar type III secretion system protein FlhB [Marinicaulis sp.]NNE41860.1 flagellar biosynthesis protein FlhB [Marinicaulis sp.]NNL90286.1 flagellar biosynthesis protein FlhB [Marinicaulis sp.]
MSPRHSSLSGCASWITSLSLSGAPNMSNENKSASEKSHDATPQKLQRSREKGDVPYSTEVTAAATYAGFFVALAFSFSWSGSKVLATLSTFLGRAEELGFALLSPYGPQFMSEIAFELIFAMSPFIAAVMSTALISIYGQRAMTFAPTKLKPKFSRISIVDNAKKKFGADGISEFAKSAAKIIAIFIVLYVAFRDRFAELPLLSSYHATAIGSILFRETIFFVGLITAVAALIAAIDLPWRLYQHNNKLKMTYQEVKEENKETEGDPAMKSVRRQRAEEMATNRMMSDVPTANVVIVNPTHFAVALKWKDDRKSAPICVAKGVDEIAARIRETASVSGVPIKSDPPTARSIYSVVELGEEIRREHYAAVAAALHYAETLRKRKRGAQ